eukprot:1057674-Pyramimonas_sp.AAC.1
MGRGTVHSIQWCDTRDMTADGHTKGSIDREMPLQVIGELYKQGNLRAGPPSFCPVPFSVLVYFRCCACCVGATGSRFVSLPPPRLQSELRGVRGGSERAPATASAQANVPRLETHNRHRNQKDPPIA